MSFDPEAHREASLEAWEAASSGWSARSREIGEWARAVSQLMIEDAQPQPGEQVLELAAGLGETGMLAAELVAPGGSVLISDQAERMLAAARERAAERGLQNVDFKVLNAEWIDLPLASMDIVLCRYGYMLMADPAAALGETRRVLRPGGRVALAVWDSIERNPWAQLPALELADRGLGQGAAGTPGPFALGDRSRVVALLEDAGFTEPRVQAVEMERRHPDFEHYWDITLDLSRSFHDTVMGRPDGEIEEIKGSLERRFEAFRDRAGGLSIPGLTLVASAGA